MRRRHATLFWGLLLIGAGIILLLVRTGLLSAGVVDWWPVAVLLIGLWLVISAARDRLGRGLTAGMVVSAVGGFYLAVHLGLVEESAFLGVLLLAMGLGVVLRALIFRRG